MNDERFYNMTLQRIYELSKFDEDEDEEVYYALKELRDLVDKYNENEQDEDNNDSKLIITIHDPKMVLFMICLNLLLVCSVLAFFYY